MKQVLTTALCVMAALALVLFGLAWGARQGWQDEYALLETLYGEMRAQQAACAANLEKVARRYLGEGEELLQSLRENPAQGAERLGKHLLTLPQVQNSPRDAGYVDSLMRKMDQLSQSGTAQAYKEAASDYDKRLETTLSGLLARAQGVRFSQSIDGGAEPQAVLPEKNGEINDFANVFSAQTLEETEAFRRELEKKTDVSLYLAAVHFLDGQEISGYAQALARKWELDENSLLILLAVGEDNYYAWAGDEVEKKLPSASRQILLSQHLQTPFLAQQYDQALIAYVPALSDALGKAYGKSLTLTGRMAPLATPAPARGFDWSQLFIYEPEDVRRVDEQVEDRLREFFQGEEKGSGISLGKTLVIALVLWLIFGKKKERGGCMGCGCAPIGWIVAALGLQKFFERD